MGGVWIWCILFTTESFMAVFLIDVLFYSDHLLVIFAFCFRQHAAADFCCEIGWK
jgi:hypothetical protein